MVVRIGAHTVEQLALNGEPISAHIRMFSKQRTDSFYVKTTLSLIRKALPERLREEMDGLERAELKEVLQTLHDLSGRLDFDTALQAMEQAAMLGRLNSANSVVLRQGWQCSSRKSVAASTTTS